MIMRNDSADSELSLNSMAVVGIWGPSSLTPNQEPARPVRRRTDREKRFDRELRYEQYRFSFTVKCHQ